MKFDLNQAEVSTLEAAFHSAKLKWEELAKFEDPANPTAALVVREQFGKQLKDLAALTEKMDLDV